MRGAPGPRGTSIYPKPPRSIFCIFSRKISCHQQFDNSLHTFRSSSSSLSPFDDNIKPKNKSKTPSTRAHPSTTYTSTTISTTMAPTTRSRTQVNVSAIAAGKKKASSLKAKRHARYSSSVMTRSRTPTKYLRSGRALGLHRVASTYEKTFLGECF